MKILFISSLSSNVAAGLSWSVPASVDAQSKIDEVLWVNLSDAYIEHWSNVKSYHNYKDFGKEFQLRNLPEPFNSPDIVVFEGLYDIKSPKFAKELRKKGIPYIIVPRCALTYNAQNNHAKWKKRIANLLFFNKYIHRAASIQYLTEDEYIDSGKEWNKNHFVLPNGFSTPHTHKNTFNKDIIKAIFIGRLDMYQKGLDYLLEACCEIQKELREACFSLCIYGPERYQYSEIKEFIDSNNLNDFISMGGETTGIHKESILLDSDLFVLTSRFEGHPMGLIEALAYGVPVMVTSGSNMANEILEYNAGWATKTTSKTDVINLLKKVISERDLLKEKSKCAIELAQRYDWGILAQSLHSECNKILNAKLK